VISEVSVNRYFIQEVYVRVNVYAEEIRELTDGEGPRVTLVRKKVVRSLPEHRAVQILVGDRFIHSDNAGGKDDDTPAVKFWFNSDLERDLLKAIFEEALRLLKGDADRNGLSEDEFPAPASDEPEESTIRSR
jgi:hypothetical protein